MKPGPKLLLRRIGMTAVSLLLGSIFFVAVSGVQSPRYNKDASFDNVDIIGNLSHVSATPFRGSDTPSGMPVASSAGAPVNAPAQEAIVTADGWQLDWDEEFDQQNLDYYKWLPVEKELCDHHELQAYQFENVYLKDGLLYITAIHDLNAVHEYTSGMIETRGSFYMLYGKMDIRLKIPEGKGLFPSIWMLNEQGEYTEIDIMEAIGSEPSKIYGGHHYMSGGRRLETFSAYKIEDPQDFHIYSLVWSPDELVWSVDGDVYFTSEKNIPQKKMYIIANLAVGGDWPGSPDKNTAFPSSLVIDYVKVYSRYNGK